jgi:polyferredoxin
LKTYGIWIIDAVFILVTWGDHVFGMVALPWVSGIIMLMIGTAVVASGALWERRTWCRYLCFLGCLSSNYSQSGMLALRGTPKTCSKCKVSACYKGTEKGPMSGLSTPKMDSNSVIFDTRNHALRLNHTQGAVLRVVIPAQSRFLAAVIMASCLSKM